MMVKIVVVQTTVDVAETLTLTLIASSNCHSGCSTSSNDEEEEKRYLILTQRDHIVRGRHAIAQLLPLKTHRCCCTIVQPRPSGPEFHPQKWWQRLKRHVMSAVQLRRCVFCVVLLCLKLLAGGLELGQASCFWSLATCLGAEMAQLTLERIRHFWATFPLSGSCLVLHCHMP